MRSIDTPVEAEVRRAWCVALLLVVDLAGCVARPATQLIVHVDTDLAQGTDPVAYHIRVRHDDGARTTGCPAIRTAQDLAVEFGSLLRAKDVEGLGRWLDAAAASEHAGFRDFGAGLRRDRPAVEAAVEGPWSNGQTEGQV